MRPTGLDAERARKLRTENERASGAEMLTVLAAVLAMQQTTPLAPQAFVVDANTRPYARDVAADEPFAHWPLGRDQSFTARRELAANGWGGGELGFELWLEDAQGSVLEYGAADASPALRIEVSSTVAVTLLGETRSTGVSLPKGRHLLGLSWRNTDGLLVLAIDGREAFRTELARGRELPDDAKLWLGPLQGKAEDLVLFDSFVHPSRWLARVLMSRGLRPASQPSQAYPMRAVPQMGQPYHMRAEWSPDGRLVASRSDAQIDIWDVTRGVLLRSLFMTAKDAGPMAFSPDGERLVTSTMDGTVRLWDVASGELVTAIAANRLASLAWSPDGERFFTSGMNTQLWSGATGAALGALDGYAARWSPDGTQIAVSTKDKTIGVYSATGALVQTLGSGHFRGLCEWSPDGSRIAASSDDKVHVFSVREGRELYTIATTKDDPQLGYRLRFAWSPDGRQLAVRGNDTAWQTELTLRDAATGVEQARQMVPSRMRDFGYNADGTRIAAATDRDLFLLDPSNPAFRRDLGRSYATPFRWSGDGGTLLSPNDQGLRFWTREGIALPTLANRAKAIQNPLFTKDSASILMRNGNAVEIFDLRTGVFLPPLVHPSRVVVASVSPDGELVLTSCEDGYLRVWSLSSGRLQHAVKVYGPVVHLTWSNDSRVVFTSLFAATRFFVLDARTGKELQVSGYERYGGGPLRFLAAPVGRGAVIINEPSDGGFHVGTLHDLTAKKPAWTRAAFSSWSRPSPDGRLIATASSKRILIVDATSGKDVKEIAVERVFESLAWAPDATWIAAATYNTNEVIVFDVASGQRRATIRLPKYVLSFAVSPDGSTIAVGTGEGDGAVRLFTPNGELVKTIANDTSANDALSFSPDGRYLCAVSAGLTLSVWRMDTLAHVTIAGGRASRWIALTDDGYFEASPNAREIVALVQGLRSYDVEQLAPARNRPDAVLKALGGGGAQEGFYRALWQRRLSRLGLDETRVDAGFTTAPRVRIDGVTPGATAGEVTVRARFADDEGLTSYQAFVNGVPLGPRAPLATRRQRASVRVPLTRGANVIEVSALNQRGVESLRATVRVEQNATENATERPAERLFFLGFGVSDYRDDALDLSFAHQDVLDLAAAFEKSEGYAATYVRTFTNRAVSETALDEARRFLAPMTEHDTLIMFLAGHGARGDDRERTYFYLDHDTRADDLAGTAIPFERFEDLLSNTPARTKLFLLDTCQSGDDVDLGVGALAAAGARGVRARSIRGIKRADAPGTEAVTKEIARAWLLALRDRDRLSLIDSSRRSGAVVIASSLGREASLEAPPWKNGAFTEELLNALRTPVADTDKDGRLDVRELVAYVARAVPKLTDDRQHPGVTLDNPWLTLRLSRRWR